MGILFYTISAIKAYGRQEATRTAQQVHICFLCFEFSIFSLIIVYGTSHEFRNKFPKIYLQNAKLKGFNSRIFLEYFFFPLHSIVIQNNRDQSGDRRKYKPLRFDTLPNQKQISTILTSYIAQK